MINTITPALFAKYPDCRALAAADPAELEPMIFKSGFYRNKAKSLLGMARACVERHGGEIPDTMEELVELPGVARKTANVVLGTAMGKNEGVVVDTHVMRVSQRLGLTREDEPAKIEQDLMRLVPRDQWTIFAHRMIWHGRRICTAKNPDHEHCLLAPICPSATLVPLRPTKHANGTTAATGGKPGARGVATKSTKSAPRAGAKPAARGRAKPAAPGTTRTKPARARVRAR